MKWAVHLERLVPDLALTLTRFPVPAAIALALCLYLNLSGSGDDGFQAAAGAAAAFIAAGSAHLFAEGRGLPPTAGTLLALAAGAAAAALGYFVRVFDTNLLFLFAGLVPVLMIAPYLHGGARQEALWLYNLRFGLAALLAAVIGVVFAAGLSGIVEALNLLFVANLRGDLHEHIWLTAMSLVSPLYGLSLMPRHLDEEIAIEGHRGTLLDRGISVLINYIAVPVIAVYALILHAYAVKILLDGELPKGQIATMVSIFAIGGTATWLVAWPWRDHGTRLLRLFMRSWFFLLLVPAGLLSIAIARRLLDYGVTPDRYGIVLVAIWVAALVLYLAIRRNRADMRAILGAMAVLLLVGSVGPMGANGLTVSSQLARLVALLERAGMLKDGKLVAGGALPADVAGDGFSIVYALKDAGGLHRLAPWFEGDPKSPFLGADGDWALAQALTERLGFARAYAADDYINFNANLPGSIILPDRAELLGPFQDMRVFDPAKKQQPMTSVSDRENVTVMLADRTYKVSQKLLLETAKARLASKPTVQPALSIDLEPGVAMLIDQMSGNLLSTPSIYSLRFWIIRRPPP